ncbi:MAG TPA: hypothetical protein VFY73_14250 [Ideonella sp.]|uniref:DUF7010 family protein n=1 Tax=Ideonella sp. TaxID=1929293 RepID=UPI002E330C38|nr:hypothetical protein [Ideonella sp.]HEX5685180.1 hypothetical protein [Ideonella sp.]
MSTLAAATPSAISLDAHRAAFAQRRFLAMPLAGTLAWTLIGIAGALLPPAQATLVLYVATGCIAYLGMFLSRFTGENFMDRSRPKNPFDGLFMSTVGMALLVYSIAIPFALKDGSSVPLSVGILAGLMWLPLSWVIQHWVGLFHTLARTVLVLAAWLAFPAHRLTVIPAVIVAIYLVTIFVLERRWRRLQG